MDFHQMTTHGARRTRAAIVLLAGSALLGLAACAPAQMTADIGRIDLGGPGGAGLDAGQMYASSLAAAGQPGRRILPNDTALAGENFISTTSLGAFGGSGIESQLRRADPLPRPFEFAIARDFAPLAGGAYSFVSSSPAEGVTCVLVVGTGGGYASGTSTMMRNCVRGDVSRALAPLVSHT